ncbi:GTP cyclohydrolase FolE2 [Acidithiobacillus sp. M4-SHS-6]|uniref:GTP cyclohydrolase FolE2 n=1 Tax=Acidithiobacillus sp. M4-SHS-6 TaxID=3383024 RepID=UPI0039BE533B
MSICATEVLEDVQGRVDPRAIPIQRVGIRAVRHPLQFADRNGAIQPSIALCNMYVSLPAHLKGTHMSRFMEILNMYDEPISVEGFRAIVEEMRTRLESDSARMEIRLPFFVQKKAPVSGVKSMLDYEVELIGEITPKGYQLTVGVMVPVTSLCPCSKSISDYGAHNQRAHVWVHVRSQESIWVRDLIDLIEGEASSELFGLLKRPDEKFVTEYAYDHPKFVEDMVRDVALRLQEDPRVQWFSVSSENFESIHNHSAYAMIEMEK